MDGIFSVRCGECAICGCVAFSAIVVAVMILREVCCLGVAVASRDGGFGVVCTAAWGLEHDSVGAISGRWAWL